MAKGKYIEGIQFVSEQHSDWLDGNMLEAKTEKIKAAERTSLADVKTCIDWIQVKNIHREIWNNNILRPELPLSPFNNDLCRVYTTSWVLKRELAAHSKSQALYQEVFS